MRTFVERSGQLWKYKIAMAAALAGGLLMLVGMVGVVATPEPSGWILVAFGGAALTLGGFFGGAASIQCPECGSRVFWHAVRTQAFEDAVRWFLSTPTCSACGSDGAAPSRQPPR
jgi:hypothetical protein